LIRVILSIVSGAEANRLLPFLFAQTEDTKKPAEAGVLWCGREDSNFHGFNPTATSTLRVYQFRHDRTW
jgi:hypothetical protein